LEKNLKLTNIEALSQMEANKYKIYIAIAENLPHCKSVDELEKQLLKHGIETQYKYKGQTQERQGVSFKIGNLCFKGSQVDRKYSYAGLTKTLELQQKQVIALQQKPERIWSLNVKTQNQSTAAQTMPQPNDSGKTESSLGDALSRTISKTLDHLLKPEHQSDQIPYELTQKEELRRKRKRSQRYNL
jgi:hypothetical protein